MQVEDYMNETPLRLLEMLTQTREDLWRAAQALTERGVTRIILTGSGTSYQRRADRSHVYAALVRITSGCLLAVYA